MSDNQDGIIEYLKIILHEISEMREENRKQFEEMNRRLDSQSNDLRAFTSRSDRLESTILQTRAETVEHRADIRDLEARVAALESRV